MLDFVYKPIIINKLRDVNKLIKDNPSVRLVDALTRQIKELFPIENNKFIGLPKEEVYSSKEFRKFLKNKKKNIIYVYYPWNFTVVKTIKDRDYLQLRTNRNRDLITYQEQEKLSQYKVAVLGMSVGSNIAIVLTQAGISSNIILADFDDLETTNLNRILAGVHQIGINKAVIAARKIYESNPFANIELFEKGIDKVGLENLLKEKKIDCIVEEIDQMQMKIDTRSLAMRYKVPVLMITDNGDWAVLHIERYDLGYNKIFEQTLEFWKKRLSTYSGKKDFADIVINNIVGGPDKIDPNMLKSAEKVVKKQLVSWPQLGSSALLGGIAVTIAIKKIVKGEDQLPFRKEYLKILE